MRWHIREAITGSGLWGIGILRRGAGTHPFAASERRAFAGFRGKLGGHARERCSCVGARSDAHHAIRGIRFVR